MPLTAQERLCKARVWLGSDAGYPAYAHLLMYMRGKRGNNPPIPTMAVDARGELWYNEEFVDGLDEKHLVTVMCHEVLHVVLDHVARWRKSWNQQLANVAADIIVNAILDKEGMELPEEGVKVENDEFRHKEIVITGISGKTLQEVYFELQRQAKKKSGECPLCKGTGKVPKSDGDGEKSNGSGEQGDSGEEKSEGSGGQGDSGEEKPEGSGSQDGSGGESGEDSMDCPCCGGSGKLEYDLPSTGDTHLFASQNDPSSGGLSDEEKERMSHEWKMRAAEAAATAKQRGKLSGVFAELVDGVLEPRIPWERELARFLTSMVPSDYTWRKPGRAARALGVYLPSIVRESIEVIFHVDTSGSVSSDMLDQFVSEARGALNAFPHVKMWLLDADYGDPHVLELDSHSAPPSFEMKGRGGTSHKGVVKWINENKPDARVFVSCTDGYSDIEECYDKLPSGCARLLVLSDYSQENADELEKYAEVIRID